jgi:hypothetical protein
MERFWILNLVVQVVTSEINTLILITDGFNKHLCSYKICCKLQEYFIDYKRILTFLLTVHLSIFISVINHLQVWCCARGGLYRCDDFRGCVMQFWPPDDEHMCSKHVEARNKLTVKQKLCASSWLITEINIKKNCYSKFVKWKEFPICLKIKNDSTNKITTSCVKYT